MRQFVSDSELDSSLSLTIEGKKYHYLVNVLRSVVGDMIYVRLPSGILQPMTLSKIDEQKKKIVLVLAGEIVKGSENSAESVQKESDTDFYLFQFAAKGPKMDLIVRQAVECGVKYIVPVLGTFCQKSAVESARKKSEGRWDRIITEARQQSGSPVDTKVLDPLSVEEVSQMWEKIRTENSSSTGIVLYEQTEGTLSIYKALSSVTEKSERKKAALVCGAEGGISKKEIEVLQSGGFIPVHFATNILRCETASLYGIAALQTLLLEKDKWQFKE